MFVRVHIFMSRMCTLTLVRDMGGWRRSSAWLCFCYSHFPPPPYLFLSVGLMSGRGGRSPQAQARGSSHGSCPSLSPGSKFSFRGLSRWLGSAIFELASWGEELCLTNDPLELHVCKTLCVSGSRCAACAGLCGAGGWLGCS